MWKERPQTHVPSIVLGNIERISERRARGIGHGLRARCGRDVRKGRLEVLDELFIGLLSGPAPRVSQVQCSGRTLRASRAPPETSGRLQRARKRQNKGTYLFRNIAGRRQAGALEVHSHRENGMRSERWRGPPDGS